jgi:hypothetical protein
VQHYDPLLLLQDLLLRALLHLLCVRFIASICCCICYCTCFLEFHEVIDQLNELSRICSSFLASQQIGTASTRVL